MLDDESPFDEVGNESGDDDMIHTLADEMSFSYDDSAFKELEELVDGSDGPCITVPVTLARRLISDYLLNGA